MKPQDHIYMAVTADQLELPIAVADTARELAALIGSTEASIWSRVTRPRGGRQCGYRVYKVELGGDDDGCEIQEGHIRHGCKAGA